MTKKIFIRILTLGTAVVGIPIVFWLSRDERAGLYSGKQLILATLVLLAFFALISFLETPRALAWNWPWHRFWFFQDLLQRERLHRREIFQGLNSDEKAALTEVVENGKRRNLLAMLLEKISSLNPVPKIFITGEGGSGKTTTMDQLRLTLAREGAKRLAFGRPVPVLLRMGSVSSGKLLDNAREVMEKDSGSSKVLSRGLDDLLKKGRIALLIDAVDESFGQNANAFREVLDLVENDDYKRTPLIISGRRGEYERQLPAFVETLNIEDLSDDAVLHLCNTYVAERRAESAGAIFSTLRGHGLLDKGGLARNPFWLELILQGGTFENNKTKIFDQAIDSLLRREWHKTGTKPLWNRVLNGEEQLLETRAALASLAHEVSIRNAGEQIDGREALRIVSDHLSGRVGVTNILRPQDVLLLGRDAQLLYFRPPRSNEDWQPVRFNHRLIREYLTANLLSKQPALLVDVFARYAGNTEWWEICLMLSSLAVGGSDRQKLINAAVGDGTDAKRLFLASAMLTWLDLRRADFKQPPISLLLESLCQNVATHYEAATSIANVAPDRLIDLLEKFTQLEEPVLSASIEKLVAEVLKNEVAGAGGGRLVSALLNSLELRKMAMPVLVSLGSPAVPHVVPVLRDSGLTGRWSAAEVLGEIRDRAAVEPLLKTMTDTNPTVRNSTITALGKIGDPVVIPHFAELMNSVRGTDEHFLLSATVGEALGEIGEPALAQLMSMLKGEESVLSVFAAEAIKQIGKLAVPVVVGELKNLSLFTLQTLLPWLADMKAIEAIGPLMELAHSNPVVLEFSEEALVKFGDAAVDPLISLIGQTNLFTQAAAIRTLAKIGGDRAFEALIMLLNTRKAKASSAAEKSETFVRAYAAQGLGSLGDKRAIEALKSAKSEEKWLIRIHASGALVQLGENEALDGVLEGLDADDPAVRDVVIRELGRLKQTRVLINLERFVTTLSKLGNENEPLPEEIQKNIDAAVDSIEQILREASGLPVEKEVQADGLEEKTPEESSKEASKERDFSGYAACLNHPDDAIRLDVVRALAEIGSPPFDLLRTALTDSNEIVRRRATAALGTTRRIEAQPLLIDRLQNDSDNAVRMAAAAALGDLGDNSVRELLTHALDDRYVVVKIGAAIGLAKLGDKDMVPLLFNIAETQGSTDIAQVVGSAYFKLEDPAAIPYLEKIIARIQEIATPEDATYLKNLNAIMEYLQQLKETELS